MTRVLSGLLFSIFREGITRSNSMPFQVTFLSEGIKEAVNMKWSNASHKFANDSSSKLFVIFFLHSSRISLHRRSDISMSLITSMRILSLPNLAMAEYRMSLMSTLTKYCGQARFIKSVIDYCLYGPEGCHRSTHSLIDTPLSLWIRRRSCIFLTTKTRFHTFCRGH